MKTHGAGEPNANGAATRAPALVDATAISVDESLLASFLKQSAPRRIPRKMLEQVARDGGRLLILHDPVYPKQVLLFGRASSRDIDKKDS